MIECRNLFVFALFSECFLTPLVWNKKKPFSEKLRFLCRVSVDGRSNRVEIKPRLQFRPAQCGLGLIWTFFLRGTSKTYTYITTPLNEAPFFSHLNSGIMHGQIIIVVENHCNVHGEIFAAQQDNKHEMIKLSLFTLLAWMQSSNYTVESPGSQEMLSVDATEHFCIIQLMIWVKLSK